MKPDLSLWAIDITMPPIWFSSRRRVPQRYMTYRCVLKRYLILKIVIDSEHYLFIMRSIFLALAVGLSLITWGGGWLITSNVSFFSFSLPCKFLFASLCNILFFATFWTLLFYHAFYFLTLAVGLPLITGGGMIIFYASKPAAHHWVWFRIQTLAVHGGLLIIIIIMMMMIMIMINVVKIATKMIILYYY